MRRTEQYKQDLERAKEHKINQLEKDLMEIIIKMSRTKKIDEEDYANRESYLKEYKLITGREYKFKIK